MSMISVTVLTKNSMDTLKATLESLCLFSEVIVYDTGSTDQTFHIAEQFPNVKIFKDTFHGFGPSHNLASFCATNDWILSIDSDEVLSFELAREILNLQLNTSHVYSLNRCNYFLGKRIRCCSGWYPDPVIRLYHRKTTRFTDDAVHEKIITDRLKITFLNGKLYHTPYRSIEDFLLKMQKYSMLFAEQHQGKKESSFWIALGHGLAAFLKNYFLKRGFIGGKQGFIISTYNAQSTYYKYLLLAFKNKSL